jgi:hypothetical protein
MRNESQDFPISERDSLLAPLAFKPPAGSYRKHVAQCLDASRVPHPRPRCAHTAIITAR